MVKFIKIFLYIILLTYFYIDTFAQKGLIVNKVRFTGNDSIPREILLDQMITKPQSLPQKLIFWKKVGGFSSFTFEGDRIRLKKIFQRNGFIDVEITHELIPDEKNKKIEIILNVKQGDAVIIDSVNYYFSGSEEAKYILDSLKNKVPLQFGLRFRDELIFSTERIIRDVFLNTGYAHIKLEKNIRLKENEKLASVDFTIHSGEKSHIGNIEIIGDSLISRRYINKHIKMEKGMVLSPGLLNSTQNDLFRLGLFRYVTVRAVTDSIKDNLMPVLIRVSELPRWSFKAGAGYGTEDRIRLSLLMTRLNFMGGGRSIIVKAQHSYFIPISLETKFIQPDLG